MFTFAIGAGPVTGLIIPELSSNRTRGKIMGFSFSVHWVCYDIQFFEYIQYCNLHMHAESSYPHLSVITFFLESLRGTKKQDIMHAARRIFLPNL